MIKLTYDAETQLADMSLEDQQLAMDAGLETAVIISLFTDARAPRATGEQPARGWWGSKFLKRKRELGSTLWKPRKASAKSMRDIELATRAALAWMIDHSVVSSVDVAVERVATMSNAYWLSVKLYKGTSQIFASTWEVQLGV